MDRPTSLFLVLLLAFAAPALAYSPSTCQPTCDVYHPFEGEQVATWEDELVGCQGWTGLGMCAQGHRDVRALGLAAPGLSLAFDVRPGWSTSLHLLDADADPTAPSDPLVEITSSSTSFLVNGRGAACDSLFISVRPNSGTTWFRLALEHAPAASPPSWTLRVTSADGLTQHGVDTAACALAGGIGHLALTGGATSAYDNLELDA